MIDEKKLIEDLSKWKDSLEDPQPFGEAGVIIRNVLKTVIDIISDQPTIQPQGIDKDRLIEVLTNYFSIGDSYCYNLTRVKTAFEVGTMSLEDFEEFDEETVYDLAEYIIKNYQQPTSDDWIPVSERLPDKDNSYEVTVEYADGTRTTTTLWFDKDWEEWHHAEATAIAWRERLPQPYKESE